MASLVCRAGAVLASVVATGSNAAMLLGSLVGLEPKNPYTDTLDPFDLTPTSSEETLRLALEAAQEQYAEYCPGGSVVAVTRRSQQLEDTFERVVVPYGNKEICRDDPVTADTLFEIGSISKPITGLVLARRIVEGLADFNLSTSLNALLPDSVPDLVENGSFVTLGQLVTHTTGLPRRADGSSSCLDDILAFPEWYFGNPFDVGTEEDLLDGLRLASEEGLNQDGRVNYSNFGFSILAYILSRAKSGSGFSIPFPDLQKELTDQLGMYNTWIESLPEAVSKDHLSTGSITGVAVPHWYDGGIMINGAGSTLSSGNDLSRYLEQVMYAYKSNSIVAGTNDASMQLQAALKQSLTPLHFGTSEGSSSTSGMAYSWFFTQHGSKEGTIFDHSGATGGFNTFAIFQPETQVGVVALSNCNFISGSISLLGEALAQKLMAIESN